MVESETRLERRRSIDVARRTETPKKKKKQPYGTVCGSVLGRKAQLPGIRSRTVDEKRCNGSSPRVNPVPVAARTTSIPIRNIMILILLLLWTHNNITCRYPRVMQNDKNEKKTYSND